MFIFLVLILSAAIYNRILAFARVADKTLCFFTASESFRNKFPSLDLLSSGIHELDAFATRCRRTLNDNLEFSQEEPLEI